MGSKHKGFLIQHSDCYAFIFAFHLTSYFMIVLKVYVKLPQTFMDNSGETQTALFEVLLKLRNCSLKIKGLSVVTFHMIAGI